MKDSVELVVSPRLSLVELSLRLAIALLAGGVIGFDRQLKDKSAGLRTHMLVSLGSAFFTLIPVQLGIAQQSAEALSRVFQGVIAGIGFIGGGVILHSPKQHETTEVKGMTTAAAIWMSCGLGIAAGCGLWDMTFIGALFSLLTLTLIKQLEN
jgi:putative Mg2+ transporter-C (MgtC) family protein